MKKTVLLTGATGAMGRYVILELSQGLKDYDVKIFVRKEEKDHEIVKKYQDIKGINFFYGDVSNYKDVEESIKGVDMVLHVAALVSPIADYNPKLAMKVNYGGTKNFIDAIINMGKKDTIKFVFIGTIAQTGDRMPPIHWGRVGDPIKASVYDYYAVSKIASERYLIESDLKYWVSLRQTGIIGSAMSEIQDAIMFHNCLDNVLEYVSDRDSGRLLGNLWKRDLIKQLPEKFWGNIYNIGGGKDCRADALTFYKRIYGELGIKKLKYVIDPKMYATRNFHGQYYLDSDILNNYLDFRRDTIDYYYECYLKKLGKLRGVARAVCKLPFGQKLMASTIKRGFKKLAKTEHGTVNFIKNNREPEIAAYWGSKKAWQELPKSLDDFKRFENWDKVVKIDHGYDESKDKKLLNLDDMKKAAKFRGGECLSIEMKTGDWKTKLKFKCAFGHEFYASPKLVLEGGHWCDTCEDESWNQKQRAKVDKFFAQVYDPLHEPDEKEFVYKKIVSPKDIE